jgi:hypothetical protein
MKVLACLVMAWPCLAQAQGGAVQDRAGPAAAPLVRTIPDEAFQRWAREDRRLIDGILHSLTQIDALVVEIERMLRQLPDFGAAPAAAPPAPPPAPAAIEKTVIREVPGPLGGWPPTLAGAALLALLAFWLGRRQAKGAPAQEKRAAPSVAVPGGRLPEPLPAQRPAPAAEKPAPPQAAPPEPDRASEPSVSVGGDQTLELAEIMLSMGLGHGATQTLTEQIRNEPKQALRHWLKLLEIYRRNGQQEEFERSAEELRLHFNVRPEDWHAQEGAARTLEDFPHIAKRLAELWGRPDCLVYIQNLLDDNRGGARSGFPQPVAEELLLLGAVMRAAYGFLPVR